PGSSDLRSRVPDVRRIAVLRANALGDYLFVVPALEALRATYPEAEITLLADAWHAPFLRGRPGPVDRVEVVPRIPGVRGGPPDPPDEVAAWWARVTADPPDIALQLHGGGKHSNPFVTQLGARVTAGLRAEDAPPLDRWVAYVYYQPEVLRYLEAVALVGAAPRVLEPSLAVTDADRAEARGALGPPTRPRVVLHPGATDPRRRWPADRFGALAQALTREGAEVVVTGVPAESPVLEAVRRSAGVPVRMLVGEVSIGGLAAVLEEAALVVSNDTGPLHLGRAVGTPTVGLYWIGNMINGGPVSRDLHRVAISWRLTCPECGVDCTGDRWPERTAGQRCRHNPSFLDEVPVDEVLTYARDLLGRTRASAGEGPAARAA
ncbi:MAG TPA: glycosyltransferase family 9 protein, partial [Miltoncostaeaceae bacterium]|nr:glycosyltransferase family 9 protein [Miltoncostaeaceae bacterium]